MHIHAQIPDFYPRSPCGERLFSPCGPMTRRYFYPRSPCGERRWKVQADEQHQRFLSTLSLRRATSNRDMRSHNHRKFLSTLSLRRATRNTAVKSRIGVISIHALLAESDWSAPCRGRTAPPFLSTLSLRRATIALFCLVRNNHNFYPRSPCGERRYPELFDDLKVPISIHALLAESDSSLCQANSQRRHFYPRSPCGERHESYVVMEATKVISIHALLAESDPVQPRRPAPPPYFYPRSPCGERRRPCCTDTTSADFYPRSPCGERPVTARIIDPTFGFLSTLSLRRATHGRRQIHHGQ